MLQLFSQCRIWVHLIRIRSNGLILFTVFSVFPLFPLFPLFPPARFGLIAAAGKIATALNILPWPEGEATKAATVCFASWLDVRGGIEAAEEREGVEAVRSFLSAVFGDPPPRPFLADRLLSLVRDRDRRPVARDIFKGNFDHDALRSDGTRRRKLPERACAAAISGALSKSVGPAWKRHVPEPGRVPRAPGLVCVGHGVGGYAGAFSTPPSGRARRSNTRLSAQWRCRGRRQARQSV